MSSVSYLTSLGFRFLTLNINSLAKIVDNSTCGISLDLGIKIKSLPTVEHSIGVHSFKLGLCNMWKRLKDACSGLSGSMTVDFYIFTLYIFIFLHVKMLFTFFLIC
jgi:hypothetical protein